MEEEVLESAFCKKSSKMLNGVATGTWTVSKACLGGGADEFREHAALPFKML